MADYIDKEAMRKAIREQERLRGLKGLGWVEVAMDKLPTITHSNEPLTWSELAEMEGQPVWVEDVKHWALIDIEKGGQWDDMPFAIWAENGVRFCYNVINRNLLCYRRPPEGEEETKDVHMG